MLGRYPTTEPLVFTLLTLDVLVVASALYR